MGLRVYLNVESILFYFSQFQGLAFIYNKDLQPATHRLISCGPQNLKEIIFSRRTHDYTLLINALTRFVY